MNLPEEKFVMKKPSKYDLLRQAVAELLRVSVVNQSDLESPRMAHIELSDWEAFQEKVKLLL